MVKNEARGDQRLEHKFTEKNNENYILLSF